MSLELVGLSIIGIIGLAIIALVWNAFWLWWQSLLSNATVGLLQIIFMRFRKVRPALIVRVRITAKKAGIDITADELEAHYLAGGDALVHNSDRGRELAWPRLPSSDHLAIRHPERRHGVQNLAPDPCLDSL